MIKRLRFRTIHYKQFCTNSFIYHMNRTDYSSRSITKQIGFFLWLDPEQIGFLCDWIRNKCEERESACTSRWREKAVAHMQEWVWRSRACVKVFKEPWETANRCQCKCAVTKSKWVTGTETRNTSSFVMVPRGLNTSHILRFCTTEVPRSEFWPNWNSGLDCGLARTYVLGY